MPGAGGAGVAEEGAPPDRHPTEPQPPAAQVVRGDHGVVGEEGAVLDRGETGQQDDGGGLHLSADLRTEQAKPHRGGEAGVEREELGASAVQQALGGPRLPADPAAHGVDAGMETERERPHEQEDRTGQRHAGDTDPERQPGKCPCPRGGHVRRAAHPLHDDQGANREGEHRQQAEHHRGQAVGAEPAPPGRRTLGRPVATVVADPRGGRSRPQLSGAHPPEDRGAGRDFGVRLDPRAGSEGAAGADAGVRADLDVADPHGLAVDPVAG